MSDVARTQPARPNAFFAVAGAGALLLFLLDLGRDAPTVQTLRLAVVVGAPLAFVVARAGLPAIAMQLMITIAFLAVAGIGLAGGAIYYVAICPLVAGYYQGARAAIAWGAIGIAYSVATPWLDPLLPDELTQTPSRLASGATTFLLLVLALTLVARRRHVIQLAELGEQQRKLEATHEELRGATSSAERRRDAAERASAERGAMLARMSHEVRTPLAAVQGLVGILKDEPLPPQALDVVSSIEASTTSLRRLVDDMLDLARLEAGRLAIDTEPFDVRSVIEDAVDLFVGATAPRGVELAGWVDPSVPTRLLGDSARLSQIVGNLLGNAVRFTQRGEVVIEVRPAAEGDGITITVRDTGAGIEPERVAKLFQPFEQGGADVYRRFGGSGLGLSLVREMLAAMGGRVRVRSELGVGTQFEIDLPWPPAPEQQRSPTSIELEHGHSVIFLEPNEATRRSALEHAAFLGVAAHAVATPADLLRDATEAKPTLVIVGAAPGLDVGAVVEQLATALPEVPRALAIGPGMSDLARQALDAGAFLTTTMRPVRRSRLAAVLEEVTEEAVERSREIATGGPLVLVVDDDPVNRRVTSRIVEGAGARVEDASTGPSALERILAGGIDLALLDLHLPGIDGAEIAQRVCAALPPDARPRMVALTASDLAEDRARCLAAGMSAYLVRPVTAGVVQGLVEEASRRRNRGARGSASRARPEPRAEAPSRGLRRAALDELVTLFGEDEARDVVREHLENARLLFDELSHAIRSGDRVSAHRAVHTLASSSRTVGADEVAVLARTVEERLRAPETGETSTDLVLLADAAERAARALEAFCAQPAAEREATPALAASPSRSPAILEIELTGHLSRAVLEAKLADLDRRLPKRAHVLVDCRRMTSYDLDARHAFTQWSAERRRAGGRIAIITPNPLWAMVVRAMAAASGAEMRAFESPDPARAWAHGESRAEV